MRKTPTPDVKVAISHLKKDTLKIPLGSDKI